jgi:protein gp37
MAARSKIEWTDSTWTPIQARNRDTGKSGWHCEHASPGCANCYAESMNYRLGTGLPFKPGRLLDGVEHNGMPT